MIRKRVQDLYDLTSTVKGHDCADTIGLSPGNPPAVLFREMLNSQTTVSLYVGG